MTPEKLKSFELLKQKVETTFKQQVVSCQESIHEWKGKQIALFQESLGNTVGGYVSEKWFYTHLKVLKNEKLPRIDMLNLLAQYVGAQSWDDFLAMSVAEPLIDKEKTNNRIPASYPKIGGILSGVLGMLGIVFFLSSLNKETTYRFCVVDQDDGTPIDYTTLQAFWVRPNESPFQLVVDSLGCIKIPNGENKRIELKVQALYYKPLVISRFLNGQEEGETIELTKDDYALMIHYFSMNKMEDWKKRRDQLGLMLSDNARIIQIHSKTGGGMALYNKEEFINKMTMPIKSLKNISILETKYEGNQIVEIRFVQNKN